LILRALNDAGSFLQMSNPFLTKMLLASIFRSWIKWKYACASLPWVLSEKWNG